MVTKHYGELVRTVMNWLSEYGARDIKIVYGGKHPRVQFIYNGAQHQYVVSLNGATDRRAVKNALSDLRRILNIPHARLRA